MKQKCIAIEDLADVSRLPMEDPKRRHLEECPRCASRLLLYQQFLAANETPGADVSSADAHLARVMRKAIDGKEKGADRAPRESFLTRLSDALFPPPALAAAIASVAVLVIAAVVVWRPWTSETPVLRGDDASVAQTVQLLLMQPEIEKDGDVRLSWTPVDYADNYIIRLRSVDLTEIATFGPTADTFFVFNRAMLPAGAPSTLLWRVVAVRKGDEIARSRPSKIKFP